MAHKLTNPKFTSLNGVPAISLQIDGVDADIPIQQKPFLLRHGIVFVLVDPGANVLPPVDVPAGEGGPSVGWTSAADTLTKDEGIFKLMQALTQAVEAGTFAEGETVEVDD